MLLRVIHVACINTLFLFLLSNIPSYGRLLFFLPVEGHLHMSFSKHAQSCLDAGGSGAPGPECDRLSLLDGSGQQALRHLCAHVWMCACECVCVAGCTCGCICVHIWDVWVCVEVTEPLYLSQAVLLLITAAAVRNPPVTPDLSPAMYSGEITPLEAALTSDWVRVLHSLLEVARGSELQASTKGNSFVEHSFRAAFPSLSHLPTALLASPPEKQLAVFSFF